MSNRVSVVPETMLQEQEAMAVRDLAMTLFRPLAKREVIKQENETKKRGFVVYLDSGENIGSGAVDEYLGVVIAKEPQRSWRMKISFLEYILTEEARYSNFREIYDFECRQHLGCTALKKNITVDVPIISSRSDLKTKAVIDTVQPNRLVSIQPMTTKDCDILSNRMLDFYRKEEMSAS
jgi:hypothetical protein